MLISMHGRRKVGAGGSLVSLDFENFSKKVFFLVTSRKKNKFQRFCPSPLKNALVPSHGKLRLS